MVGLGSGACLTGIATIDTKAEAKAAAASINRSKDGSSEADGIVVLTLNPLKKTDNDFEVGGRSGNVVIFSNNCKIGKGWRLLQINGVDVGSTQVEVATALGAARKKKASFTATFFGGKIAGGGGMNMEALAKAAASMQTLKKLAAASPPAAAAPPPPQPPQPPPPPPPPPPPLMGGGQGESLFGSLYASLQQPAATPPAPAPPAADHPHDITKAELRVEFISFDYDRDGKLSTADFSKMLQANAASG